MCVHRVRHKTLISERVGEAHVRKVLAHARRNAHDLLSPHACVEMGALDRRCRDGVLTDTASKPNFDMYISSLFDGVSDALGLSWKAFQWTLAWTPVDRSAVSKLRLPTQQKGQTTSLMISTTARFWSAAAMAVARPRARIVTLLNSALTEHCTCTPNVATVMSRAREQALWRVPRTAGRFLRASRAPEQPQQAKNAN